MGILGKLGLGIPTHAMGVTVFTTDTITVRSLLFTTNTDFAAQFTPPPACSTHWSYENSMFNSIDGGVLRPNIQNDLRYMSLCYPPSLTSMGLTINDKLQRYYPGQCPYGSTVDSSEEHDGTTYGACCFKGFSYQQTLLDTRMYSQTARIGCVSMWTGRTTVLYESEVSIMDLGYLTGSVSVWEWPLFVAWTSTNLPSLRQSTVFGDPVLASYTTTSGTSLGTQTSILLDSGTSGLISSSFLSISTTQSLPTGLESGNEAASRLATGSIVAIAVGSILALAIFFIIPIILFLIHKRRQRRRLRNAEPDIPQNLEHVKEKLGANEEGQLAELSSEPIMSKTEDENRLYELDATPREFEIYAADPAFVARSSIT